MMNFFKTYRTDAWQAVPQITRRHNLTRAFVETGDERCPLAGIWSRLPETDDAINFEADDDPGFAWPAWGVLLLRALYGRAFRLRVISAS